MITGSSVLAFAFCLLTLGQDEGTRQIIPEEFVKRRPARTATAAPRRASYRRATAQPRAGNLPGAQQVGLTVWRLRPASGADTGARIVVHDGDEDVDWTPERVEADSPLRVGDRIRFSVESPQDGYLYVINRENYADGTAGQPYLIFPTLRTRGGDNRVSAGRLIELPGQEDRPNYFRLRQGRPDQVSEQLIILVTAQPLEGLAPGAQALELAPDQLAAWEKSWSAPVERFEMVGGAGLAWTRSEQEAGADGTRRLTQEDPAPQTVYRVATRPGEPLLVKVALRYRRAKAR